MVAFLARILLRLLYRVEVRGELHPQERLLIVANHTSFLDGILLGAFLPLWPTYLVHTTIARIWYFRIGLRFLPHLVVDSASPLAIKAIVGILEQGKPVVIFPEGRITVTGSLMKIYDGPAFVAAKTGSSVVAVHIDGAIHTDFSRMREDFPRSLFPKITLTIQPPVMIAMPAARTAKERRRLASEQMRKIMQRSAFLAQRPQPLFHALLDAIRIHGRDRTVIEDVRQKPESYGQLLKASLAMGRLVSRFTREGEAVGVLMPNVTTTVALLFGMFAMRRTAAMLNYSAGREGMQNACQIAGVKTVFTSRAFLSKGKLTAAVEGLQNIKLIYAEDLRAQFGLADKLWLILWATRFPRLAAKKVNPADPAVILFTSGSEGVPKGVALSHCSLLANTQQIGAVIEFGPQEKFLNALPLFHAFGLTAGSLLPLLYGARVFLYPSPLHYRMIPELAYDRDCTVLFSTNTFLGHYAKVAHPYDFYRLKYLVVGAEKLTEDVRQLCVEKFGIRPLEGYGATECSPVISVCTPLANRVGTVGELLPGMDYQLEPVDGISEGGRLHVRGPNVMLGYLKQDQPGRIQSPSSIFGPGWYDTGDIVTISETGFLTIQGRMRRFAKIAGEMVSLEVVERIAAAAQPKHLHAAVSIKDRQRGESLVLYTQDPELRREQLQAAARASGAPEIAIPRRIVYVAKIPLLGNGKKDYVTLTHDAEAEAAQVSTNA